MFRIAILILVVAALAALLTFCAKRPAKGAGGGPPGAAAGGGGGGRGRGGGRGGAGGRPPTTVNVAKATLGAIPIQVQALGTVTPVATVNVNARVSGQLDRVAFKEGQMVRRGQLLAQIDPRPFQVAVQQAQGQLLRDQAALKNAQLDLQRYRTLKAQDSIAGQTVDTQAALVAQDQATVASDQANVANAQLNLSFTHVVSPVTGKAGLRQVDPGNQIVANSSTPITVVTQLDPITVVFALPETDLNAVLAQHRGIGLAVDAYDRTGGTVLAHGRLAALDSTIDVTTGTIKAKATFGNAGGALFPNQFVNVVLLVNTLENQVTVPTTAVRHGPQGDYVWVLQTNKTVKARPVKVGPGTSETVSIDQGLQAGETVITEGGDRLRDGGPVILPGQSGRGGAGGGGHGGHRHGGGQSGGGQSGGGSA